MRRISSKAHLFFAAAIGMTLYGVVATTIGAILPEIIAGFRLEKSQAGFLFSVLSAGIFSGSLLFGPIVDRQGYKRLLVCCALVLGLGLCGIAMARNLLLLEVSVYLVGLGGGAINGSTNALVADVNVSARGSGLSVLGVFFGIGAFGIPFILGFLLASFSYSVLIGLLGWMVLAPMLYFSLLSYPDPKRKTETIGRDILVLCKEPSILFFGAVLFLQSGTEMIVGGWTSTFFIDSFRVAPERAVHILSIFWFAMIVSRPALGYLLTRYQSFYVVTVYMGLALVGALFWVSTGYVTLGTGGLFLTGFGLAAGFPVLLGRVADLFPQYSGTAFSVILVIAIIGGTLFGPLAGFLAEPLGMRGAMGIIPVNLLVMFGLLIAGKKYFYVHT